MINCDLSEPLRRYLQQGIRAVFNSDTTLRQCSHLVPGHRARVLFYAGHQCEHTFFPGTHARIRARCRCPSTRSRPCTRALNWALSPCVNTFFVGALALYPQTTCFCTHNSLSHSRFQNGVRRCKVESG